MANRAVPSNNQLVYLDGNFRYIYGTKIVKNLNGVVLEGQVTVYNNNRKEYKIRYMDGSEENMNHRQVNENLKRYKRKRRYITRKKGKATSVIGQTNLYGEILSIKDSNTFGDVYPKQPAENCSIITYQNTGQQPFYRYDKKATKTSESFRNSKASIALYAEVSICEGKLEVNHRFNDRMQQYNPRSYSVVSSNKHLKNETPWNLVGATALTIDESFASHRTQQSIEKDPRGLGRWVAVRLRGRQQMHIRIVSAYRPCHNVGPATTWTQHLNHFRNSGIASENPRDKFDEDLSEKIKSWIEDGDNIIIGIDMNEDAYSGKLHRVLKQCGLKPLIQSRHPNESPPATFDGNHQRLTIEEIWGTEDIEINRAGFMPFDDQTVSAPSDGHRMLWIEVNNDSILGKEAPHSHKFQDPSKFPSIDPRCRKSFGKQARKGHLKKDLFKAKTNLTRLVKKFKNGTLKNVSSFKKKYSERFDSLQSATYEDKLNAGKIIKNIKAGKRHWSPKYKNAVLPVEFWRRIMRWKLGRNSSREKMKELAKELTINWHDARNVSKDEAIKKWKDARNYYYGTKHLHERWRKEFQNSLIDALAEEEKVSRDIIKKRMKREEQQRVLGGKSKRLRGKGFSPPVFRAISTNEHGEMVEHNDQESMIPVIAESNCRRQQQCRGTPFMTSPLVDIFGHLANKDPAHQVIEGTFEIPEEIDPAVAELIRSLKMPDSIKKKIRYRCTLLLKRIKEAGRNKKIKQHQLSAYLAFIITKLHHKYKI